MQRLNALLADRHIASSLHKRYPEYPRNTRELTVPTSVAPARAVVYVPDRPADAPLPPVHVNFHGGGFVLPPVELDDPLCRFLAAEAGVVVVNVDYVVAPQHPFPAPPLQAYEVVAWVERDAFAHAEEALSLSPVVAGVSARGAGRAAVLDGDTYDVRGRHDDHVDRRGEHRVLEGVGQRFLDDAVHGELQSCEESGESSLGAQGHGGAGGPDPFQEGVQVGQAGLRRQGGLAGGGAGVAEGAEEPA
ncbi:alpha/beta hydrolase [Streptomyces caniscabiei]|nr:alpha/beta hydrolase [Streptomyces caniscabiei]MDX3726058.1 alpha/beta hydrolase [Streptomyces caniscabiei]